MDQESWLVFLMYPCGWSLRRGLPWYLPLVVLKRQREGKQSWTTFSTCFTLIQIQINKIIRKIHVCTFIQLSFNATVVKWFVWNYTKCSAVYYSQIHCIHIFILNTCQIDVPSYETNASYNIKNFRHWFSCSILQKWATFYQIHYSHIWHAEGLKLYCLSILADVSKWIKLMWYALFLCLCYLFYVYMIW